MMLDYRSCPDATEERNVRLECLGSWRNGVNRYLIGRITHTMANSNEEIFHCFMYKMTDSGVQLAQSADATCNALFSPQEGPQMLTMTPGAMMKSYAPLPGQLIVKLLCRSIEALSFRKCFILDTCAFVRPAGNLQLKNPVSLKMTALEMLELVLSMVLVLQSTKPCPVKQAGLTRELINMRLDNAIRSAKNGIIQLKESSINEPVETRPEDSIIRSPEEEQQDYTAKAECLCRYTLVESNPATGEMIVDFLAFSHFHAGKYECLRYNGSSLLTTQTFFVSPTVTPSQVFRPPMPNVTVRVGGTARFPCYVKFLAMPGDFGKRFLWRDEDHVIYSPGNREIQTGHSTMKNFEANVHIQTDGMCQCHSTLEILHVQSNHAGRYQCLFKVDDVFHEWITQEAYLTVIA
ncbi:uncharacterized protein LOC129582832 [Paramacrobiotus metropolitanus]|uniref:uncharacterized protein LOC129582832 n=1 Tax=Paramacrobiotus metropolitanus TaxID=2943436 RepID=UPI002445C36B|nr:uncharacterized protein LOC129582832 [Paramacrobiotus metropolitanus]